MKPSVGRIVHYHLAHPYSSYATAKAGALSSTTGPIAALVTAVAEDGETVALSLHYPGGAVVPASFVKHAPGDKPTPECWNWPPREQ